MWLVPSLGVDAPICSKMSRSLMGSPLLPRPEIPPWHGGISHHVASVTIAGFIRPERTPTSRVTFLRVSPVVRPFRAARQ